MFRHIDSSQYFLPDFDIDLDRGFSLIFNISFYAENRILFLGVGEYAKNRGWLQTGTQCAGTE